MIIEIGIEELPARFVDSAREQLLTKIIDGLTAHRLSFGECASFGTPRRIAVSVSNLADRQEDLHEEIKGPPKNIAQDKEGNLTKAGLGFGRSQGVSAEQLFFKEFNGVEYLYARRFTEGQDGAVVLEALLPDIVRAISFPKNMRWGDGDMRYARPLRWILAMYGGAVIPFEVESVHSSNTTFGHRQLAPAPIVITDHTEYLDVLEKNYVIADHHKRKDRIASQVRAIAAKHGGKALLEDDLLDEVTNLVEYPTAFCGTFSSEYLAIPREVLVTTMKEHQRYFPVLDAQGELLPLFVGVRNGADNHIDLVSRGNEKVLRARLADAKFFFDEDMKMDLEKNVERLKKVVFQEGLGSMFEKVKRIERISASLAERIAPQERDATIRTAYLAKSDLVSHMVYEFPELQGVMGEKYARLGGEQETVAQGIAEHYKPKFTGDSLPVSVPGTLVALADKLDTLVGYFALGKVPSGSQDPFALRRQALGVVQILAAKEIDYPIHELIALVLEAYGPKFGETDKVKNELANFFAARIRALLIEDGYKYDTVDAVLGSGDDRVPSLYARTKVLEHFRQDGEFLNLYTAYERVANLAAKAKDEQVTEEYFTEDDITFYGVLQALEGKVTSMAKLKEYTKCLQTLAQVRPDVDHYFDAVMIMDKDENIRQNRLSLLKKAVNIFRNYADFGIIVVNL